MKRMALLMLALLSVQAPAAGERADSGGVDVSHEAVLMGTTLLEVAGSFTRRYTIPFLRGGGPLTADNNVSVALTANVAPIYANAAAEAVWTPAAFAQLSVGGRAGSGWNIDFFGTMCYGIGINREKEDGAGAAEVSASPFDGLLWKTHAGGALQFDLAAVIPGDWNHVVARSYHEINYKGYTRAKPGESWYNDNDFGENCNGLNYHGDLLVGYQTPAFVNTVGLLTEADLYLYDTPGRESWRDDKFRWTFTGLVNFTVVKQRLEAALLLQFRTRWKYTDGNWQDLYYRKRTIDANDPVRMEFYRLAAAVVYKL